MWMQWRAQMNAKLSRAFIRTFLLCTSISKLCTAY
ncbi:Uncharacterised protein [Vibrio cholerae]|nr:Uncharacterised protein [Vibrio cholerae]CSI54488.1 Uncharacterised protein [Vibrio cholerae]